MMRIIRSIFWTDCIAAALAGTLVLIFSEWFSGLHSLPRGLLLFIGVVNVFYASYSFILAKRSIRSRAMINVLVFANLGWATACLGLVLAFSGTATMFGIAHLVGEAIFVGGLASLEWRWRDLLLQQAHKGTMRK